VCGLYVWRSSGVGWGRAQSQTDSGSVENWRRKITRLRRRRNTEDQREPLNPMPTTRNPRSTTHHPRQCLRTRGVACAVHCFLMNHIMNHVGRGHGSCLCSRPCFLDGRPRQRGTRGVTCTRACIFRKKRFRAQALAVSSTNVRNSPPTHVEKHLVCINMLSTAFFVFPICFMEGPRR